MNTAPYQMRSQRASDSWTVSLSGEIDYAAALALGPELGRIAQSCSVELLFDLGQVTLLDSEGLKLLLGALEEMRQKNCAARVIRCSKNAERVLRLSGVHELLGSGNAV